MKAFAVASFISILGAISFANVCTTTIKCNYGSSTCTSYSSDDSIGECGVVVGNALNCHGESYNDRNEQYSKRSTFICCKQSGTAFVTNSEVVAKKECANIGVVQ